MAEDSSVLAPDEQERVAESLQDDAELMSNTQLEELLDGQPADVQDEIVRINADARPRALQVALLVPLVAALLGLIDAFRMMRLPDPEPAGDDIVALGLTASVDAHGRGRPAGQYGVGIGWARTLGST